MTDPLNPNPAPRTCDECGCELMPQEGRGTRPLMWCDNCVLDDIARRHRVMSETAGIDAKPQS